MSWLSNIQIIRKVNHNGDEKTKKAFYGVFPIDELPDFVPHLPIIIVINTHTHNLAGEHWKTIFIDEERNGELFDSLALPVSNIIIRWMNRFTHKWKRNTKTFQHWNSATCGAFALYFILHRLSVSDMNSLTKSFSAQPYVNERKMLAFYRRLK